LVSAGFVLGCVDGGLVGGGSWAYFVAASLAELGGTLLQVSPRVWQILRGSYAESEAYRREERAFGGPAECCVLRSWVEGMI
jgi:hypothetical protein